MIITIICNHHPCLKWCNVLSQINLSKLARWRERRILSKFLISFLSFSLIMWKLWNIKKKKFSKGTNVSLPISYFHLKKKKNISWEQECTENLKCSFIPWRRQIVSAVEKLEQCYVNCWIPMNKKKKISLTKITSLAFNILCQKKKKKDCICKGKGGLLGKN